jgi:hypothetical protein
MAPPPGDVAKTGEEYLATIPPSLAGQVKALAEGRRAFPTGSALRSPAVQQLIAAATQYDPTLDAANAATRVATRKDFTSGKSAQNITAINTALGHFGTLWKASQGLENRSIPAWNALANTAETATGDPRVNKFNIARNAVVNELERVFRGTGGSEADIAQWRSTLHSSMSPDQLRESIAQGVDLLNSRLQALGSQYNQGLSRSDDPISLLNPHSQAVFTSLAHGGTGILPDDTGGPQAPPALGPGGPPPMGGDGLPGSVPKADFSGMTGANASLATGDPNNVLNTAYKSVPDNPAAATLAAFVRHGRPYQDVAAYAQSHSFNPPPEKDYLAAVTYQKANPGSTPNVEALRNVQMSFGEKAASSPLAAGVAGALSAGTAGFDDLAGHLIGGSEFDANRQALADVHPRANMIGNVAGGFGAALAAPALAARIPGALGLAGRASNALGRFAPLTGDAAYGATYGANESPDDPLMGGFTGGIAGAIGGGVGRSATRGLANVIAPPAGGMAPLYERGVLPTIGQRFARSGLAGRIANTAEQALQSVPFAGSLISRSRQGARNQFQLGAFNDALGDIGHALPDEMVPGTEPHAFTQQAFDNAYQTARTGMQFVPDQNYIADHQAFSGTLNNGVLSAPQAQQVQQVINNAVGSRLPRQGGAMAGDAYDAASDEIGRAVRTWGRSPDTSAMANALRDYQTLFDNAARRNSNPQAVQMLDQADRGYAKFVRIEDAARRVGGDAGTFTPTGFDRSVQNNAGGVRSRNYLRGDALMQDLADAGRGLVDTMPTSGTPERLMWSRVATGSGGLALGAEHALVAHPGALAPFSLYLPGVDQVVKRAIAPNAQRFSFLAPEAAAALDNAGARINNLAPLIGRIAAPASHRLGDWP